MAKKQPKKSVKIEELVPATTVETVVETVKSEADSHSMRVGLEMELQNQLKVITNSQSGSLYKIVTTLLLGKFWTNPENEVETSGGIRELVNLPDATEDQRCDIIASVVRDLYRHWTSSLRDQAISDGIVDTGKYTNKAESLRLPINILAMTFIWGTTSQITRVLNLGKSSMVLKDVRNLAKELEQEYVLSGDHVTGGSYKDSKGKDHDWSLAGLNDDNENIIQANKILKETLEANGLESRFNSCLNSGRKSVRKKMSRLIPDGRSKIADTAEEFDNDLSSEAINNARVNLKTLSKDVKVAN
tara:strand:+ start:1044 stop:1949 length:906 start_codon:yes stop_codon:yes gene_type:complete